MSNKGEIEIHQFKQHILADLLRNQDINFDLIILNYDPCNDLELETNIALLIVNEKFYEFKVKSFPIVFTNDTFCIKKYFGLGKKSLREIDNQIDTFNLETNTNNMNNYIFKTPKNRMRTDIESEILAHLRKDRICIGFSIRKNKRFVANSWILKVSGVGELLFMINNVLIKVSFWHYN